MNTEFVRGLLEGEVEIQPGDNLIEKMGAKQAAIRAGSRIDWALIQESARSISARPSSPPRN